MRKQEASYRRIHEQPRTDILAFGEVFWDVIEGVPHLGGAPFNFAAHVVKCGLEATVVSAVGRDKLGVRARAVAQDLGVDCSCLAVHPALPTGTVNVTLKDGLPSYEIVEPVAWDEIVVAGDVLRASPRALYFGTLAQRSPISAATLATLLDAHVDACVFFDVNLCQSYWSRERVLAGIAHSDILKVNEEERRTLGLEPDALFADYPRLKTVVETRGADGCAVWSRSHGFFTSPACPDGPVVDTVGVGDSFAAAFLAALLEGTPLKEAARLGNIRAGKVAARAGAIPEDL